MSNVVVAENHLTFGGVAYFRGHAEEVELGSTGQKRAPLTKQNYLEVKDRIPAPKIGVAKSTAIEIDFTKTTRSAFQLAVSAIVKGVPVQFAGDATFDKLKSGELKLVKFSVDNNQMEEAANASPKALQDLIDWGDDARIAHQVFIVMEASLANRFSNNVTATLSVGAKGLEAKVGAAGSASGTTTVQIGKGTCFAYLLVKPKWDAALKKNRTRIVDLNDDQWSLG